jgi:hypothetical protein
MAFLELPELMCSSEDRIPLWEACSSCIFSFSRTLSGFSFVILYSVHQVRISYVTFVRIENNSCAFRVEQSSFVSKTELWCPIYFLLFFCFSKRYIVWFLFYIFNPDILFLFFNIM